MSHRKSNQNQNLSPTVRVDSKGKLANNDTSQAFWAYPAMPVRFGVPAGHSNEITMGQLKPDNVVGQAVFYISQDPVEGRKLIKNLADEEVVFRLSSPYERSFSEGAPVSYVRDWIRNKRSIILYATPDQPIYLAHALVEEFRHVRDIERLGFAPGSDTNLSLQSYTIADRAIEASGQAAVARFAFTCHLQQKQNPRQFSPPQILETLEEIAPELYAASLKVLPLLEEGRRDLFTQEIFASIYKDTKFLATYDEWRVNFYLDNLPSRGMLTGNIFKNPPHGTFMQDNSITHERIANVLEVDGIKYLQNAPFRLDDPEFTKLSDTPVVTAALKRLREKLAPHFPEDVIEKMIGTSGRPARATDGLRLEARDRGPDIKRLTV